MNINLSPYSKIIKILAIIPLIVAILGIIDQVLPLSVSQEQLVEKKDSFRVKTQTTTYTLSFENVSEQVTEEIYRDFQKGDVADLYHTPIKKQIRKMRKLPDGKLIENDTYEFIFVWLFILAFLYAASALLKKGSLRRIQANITALFILISIADLIRIVFIN